MGVIISVDVGKATGVLFGVGILLDKVQDESERRIPIPTLRQKKILQLIVKTISLPIDEDKASTE